MRGPDDTRRAPGGPPAHAPSGQVGSCLHADQQACREHGDGISEASIMLAELHKLTRLVVRQAADPVRARDGGGEGVDAGSVAFESGAVVGEKQIENSDDAARGEGQLA
jgi:hypothetical protein